jgi:hypothetical protein
LAARTGRLLWPLSSWILVPSGREYTRMLPVASRTTVRWLLVLVYRMTVVGGWMRPGVDGRVEYLGRGHRAENSPQRTADSPSGQSLIVIATPRPPASQ